MNVTYIDLTLKNKNINFFHFTINNNMDENKISEICTCDPIKSLLNPFES